MLAGGSGVPSAPDGWLVEPKWDGVRAVVTLHEGVVTMASRNDNDITGAYPELCSAPPAMAGHSAVLDGEVIAMGPDATPSFGELQRRMHVRDPPARLVAEVPVTLMVFDVLWLGGRLLVNLPQLERRAILDAVGLSQPPWLTSPVLDLPAGDDLLVTCRELGLEGFVVKRADAAYEPGRRSAAWRKVKCVRRREFVVGGWSPGQGRRSGGLGSLALGVYDRPAGEERQLLFVGMAGSGLANAELDAFRDVLGELGRATTPFANATPRGVRFLEPVLVAQVTFSEVTAAGTLRHPRLDGFRTDIDAADVVVDAELA